MHHKHTEFKGHINMLQNLMQTMGQANVQARIANAQAKGNESRTEYGQSLIKQAVEPVALAIQEFTSGAAGGKAGRRHAAIKYLLPMDPYVAAFVSLTTVIDRLSKPETLNNMAIKVAAAIETEQRWAYYEQEQPHLLRYSMQASREYTRRKGTIHRMNEAGVEWDSWGLNDKLSLGMKLLEILVETTGYIEIVQREGLDTTYEVHPTKKVVDWISDRVNWSALMQPMWMPTTEPPKPWDSPVGGGYPYSNLPSLRLVKNPDRGYQKALEGWRMPLVYQAINHLQNVGWRINQQVLSVARECQEKNLAVSSIVETEDIDIPTRPEGDWNSDEVKAWRKEASKLHIFNAENRSKRLTASKLLFIAEKCGEYPVIYFPYSLDFRGRIYAVPQYLNPQGNDLAKGLLLFSEGQVLDDQGFYWFCVHGANVYGEDKLPFDARVQWTADNHDWLCAIAEDPISNISLWSEADKPWQFLAWCLEYHAYCMDQTHKVSLPVALDGSCSGIQHYSMLLQDAIGGRSVNLLPCDKPQDIYRDVADKVRDILMQEKGGQYNEYASAWLALGFDRKLTKRCTMIVPYGGTQYGFSDYIVEYMATRKGEGHEWVDKGDRKYATYMARVIYDAIGETVIAARDGMAWLQESMRVIVKKTGGCVTWVTPAGFLVSQRYLNTQRRRVKTKFFGNLTYISVHEDTDEIDARAMANGVAPNFIHSLDSTHLMMSVLGLRDAGIHSIGTVHDSFSVLPNQAAELRDILKTELVSLYSSFDLSVVKEQWEQMYQVSLPNVPPKGDLNLMEVLESGYAFS